MNVAVPTVLALTHVVSRHVMMNSQDTDQSEVSQDSLSSERQNSIPRLSAA